MSRTVNVNEEIIVVSRGEEDTGKMAMLGAEGKFHKSVIPVIDDLQEQITKEVTERAEADKQLQTNIDAETSARISADQQLQRNIEAEATARDAADKDFEDKLAAEITARTNADTQLQANLDAEGDARTIADKSLQDQIDLLKGKKAPRCKAHLTSNIAIPSGVKTSIPMQAVDYDTDNIHTNDPTKFQINTSGLYLIVHQNFVTPNSFTFDELKTINTIIEKNGNEIIANLQPSMESTVSALTYMEAGDYIKANVYHTSGQTLKTNFGSDSNGSWVPYISIVKISN